MNNIGYLVLAILVVACIFFPIIWMIVQPYKNLRRIKDFRSKKDGYSNLINYFGLVKEGVMLNVDGSLMVSFWFRGDDLDSSSAEELAARSAYTNMALSQLDEGFMVHVDNIKYKSSGYIAPSENFFPEPIFDMLDEERREIYEAEGQHFEDAFVMTITWLPPADLIRKAGNFYLKSTGSTKIKTQLTPAEIVSKFCMVTGRVKDRLLSAFPFVCQMISEEMMTYLNRCGTGNNAVVKVPKNPFFLQQIFANQDLVADSYPKIGKNYIQIVAITGFPMESYPGIMDDLNSLPFEYRWTTRFIFMTRDKAKKLIDKVIKFWAAGRMNWQGWLATTFNPGARVVENPDALAKEADATAALGEVTGNYVKAGFYTNTVTIFDENLESAIAKAEVISNVFDNIGFKSRVETMNAVDAYFGSLPGYGYQNVRKPTLNTLVLSDLLPQTAKWTGLQRNPCPYYERYNTPPLMITSSGTTPFRLNLHNDDIGHTLIAGPTGSGKSTLLSLLVAQQFRYKYAKVFVFDRDHSLFPLIAASNGAYYDLLGEDTEFKFQPLMPPNLINEDGSITDLKPFIAWVTSWLEDVCRVHGLEINVTRSKIIYDAVVNVLNSNNIKRWRMDELHSAIQGDSELSNVIKNYTESGQFSFFDGDKDSIQNNNMIGFEMGKLINTNNQALIFTTLTYLFEKVRQQLTGSPTLLVIEEIFTLMDNPVFLKKLVEWLNTLRKANVAVIIVTPDVGAIVNSPAAAVISNQCQTKIYLPNPGANDELNIKAYQKLGLQKTEIEIISNMVKKREYYFVNPLGRRVFNLNMSQSSTPIALSILGKTGPQDIKDAKRIWKSNPTDFAFHWLKHCGLEKAANDWLFLAKNKYDKQGLENG